MSTQSWKDYLNKYRPMDLPEDDESAADLMVRDFKLTGPVERQQLLDFLDNEVGNDMSAREYGRYRTYATRLKDVHQRMRKIGR